MQLDAIPIYIGHAFNMCSLIKMAMFLMLRHNDMFTVGHYNEFPITFPSPCILLFHYGHITN